MSKTISYFVSYAHPKGFGNIHLAVEGGIHTENTNEIEDYIANKTNHEEVAILYYAPAVKKRKQS